MKTFTDRWRQLEWDDIRLRINGKTAADVERALNAAHLSRDDLMVLLSPAAADYLEPMAQRAQKLTRQRFGNTVSFYVPLYLSNLCANDCTYCGFSMSNRIKRKTLDEVDIQRECDAIRKLGFEHLLLVTGEHQAKVGMDYFRRHLPAIRRQFSSLQMEVQPLSQENYAELKTLGIDGVMVYQETYHEAIYAQHHLKGKKQDFFLAAGNAGSVRPGRYRQNRSWRANWSVGQLAGGLLYGGGASVVDAETLLAESLFCFLPASASVYWRCGTRICDG